MCSDQWVADQGSPPCFDEFAYRNPLTKDTEEGMHRARTGEEHGDFLPQWGAAHSSSSSLAVVGSYGAFVLRLDLLLRHD